MKYAKQARHRLKKMRAGICPRCTRRAAPFTHCEYHRRWWKVNRALNRLAKAGAVTKYSNGGYQIFDKSIDVLTRRSDSPTDRRHFPRLGKQYFKIEELAEKVLRQAREPLKIKEIDRLVFNEMARLKKIRRDELDAYVSHANELAGRKREGEVVAKN